MNTENKSSFLCTLSILGGVALFSTIEIAGKLISNKAVIEPFTMVFIRFFVAGVALLALSLPPYLRKHKLDAGDFWVFMLNGFVGIAASITLFHAAIGMFSNASSSAVVFSANALFTVVLARFINKEALSTRKCIAVGLGVLGISMFIFEKGAPQRGTIFGICTMCLSALFFGVSVCITRRVVKKYGAMLFMGASSLLGAFMTLPLALYFMPDNSIAEIRKAFPEMCYMVFVGTTLSYVLYYYGLSGLSAFKASMAFFLKPVLACILAYFYAGEVMNAWTIGGTVLIVLAMCMTLNVKKTAPSQ